MMASGLVEAWRMSDEMNRFLLDRLPEACLDARYDTRTRTVAAQFAHMHAVRRRWLAHAAPDLAEGLDTFGRAVEPGREALLEALASSVERIARFIVRCEADGTVPRWKGPPATFVGYLVAHEAHHRGLAMVSARLAGHRLPDEIVYGQWQWGKRRRMGGDAGRAR